MKIKVIKNFKDLQEDVIRNTGDIFEVTDSRYKEINSKLPGYVQEVKEEKPKKKATKKKAPVCKDC